MMRGFNPAWGRADARTGTDTVTKGLPGQRAAARAASRGQVQSGGAVHTQAPSGQQAAAFLRVRAGVSRDLNLKPLVVTRKARWHCGTGRGLVVANHVAVRCRESLMYPN